MVNSKFCYFNYRKSEGTRVWTLILILVYKTISEYIYSNVLVKSYYMDGFVFKPNISLFIFSTTFTVLTYLLIPKDNRPSTYFINILYIFTIVPILSILWLSDESLIYSIYVIICFILIIAVLNFKSAKFQFHSIVFKSKPLSMLPFFTLYLFIFLMIFIINFGIPNFDAFHLDNIYNIRSEISFNTFWSYLISWTSRAIIPFVIALSLYRKKYFYTFIAVFIQVFLFMYTANKTMLFSVPFLMGIYYVVLKSKQFMNKLIIGLVCIQLLSLLVYFLFDSITLISFVSYRTVYIPAKISYNYFDFFSVNEKIHFSEMFIGRIFGLQSPYNEFSTILLGNGRGNANTGMFGDAFSNGGFLAMVIYSIVFGFFLRLINSFNKKSYSKYLYVIVVSFSYIILLLNDNSLTVTIMTSGMWILLLIYFILTRPHVYKT